MKKYNWPGLIRLFLPPVVLMALGVILIIYPDTAAALVANVAAWILILVGTGCGIAGLLGSPRRRVWNVFCAAAMLGLGIWMLNNPLLIARGIGKFMGILLIVEGVGDLISARRRGIAPLVTAAMGVVLVLLPMTTSRIFFTIIGIVTLGAGAVALAGRIRRGDFRHDPDVFDV